MSQDKKHLDLASLFEPRAKLEEQHYTEPTQIVCKWCGSKDIMKYGIRDGIQEYIC
jgi:hypothetical protein